MKRLIKLIIAGLAALSLTGCSNSNQPKSTDKTTITFWHGMSGAQGSELKALTKQFEKANPNIKVKLQNQGTYPDLQAKINSTLQSPKNLPTITQAYSGWLWTAANSNMLVNVSRDFKNADIRSDLLKGAQINGIQYGVPFNKSIEVLFYNQTLLKKYGVKVPTTMQELKQASKTIYEKSHHQTVGAGFDHLGNYYMLAMKNEGVNFTSKINFTGKTSAKVINYYADGVKDGYFRIAGSEHYLSGPFANQKVAMFIGTSAGESFVKKGVGNRFTYSVAKRPGKYTISQGTDIYMFKQASQAQQKAAIKYMKFLTSKSAQTKWAKATGYIPVNNGAITPKLSSMMQHLYSVPATKNANSTYQLVSAELQGVLAGKGDAKQAIKAVKTKFDASWRQ